MKLDKDVEVLIITKVEAVSDVPGLDVLGKIVIDDVSGYITVYSGKEQWLPENNPTGHAYVFYPGDRLTKEFIKHIDMEGCFGGPEHDTIEPKTFNGYTSEAFLVPVSVMATYEGKVYA